MRKRWRWEAEEVPVLPTVGAMDYPFMGYLRNPFAVHCVGKHRAAEEVVPGVLPACLRRLLITDIFRFPPQNNSTPTSKYFGFDLETIPQTEKEVEMGGTELLKRLRLACS